MPRHLSPLVAVVVLGAACNPEVVCPDGTELVDGRCLEVDAGTDGAVPDAMTDAPMVDAPVVDAPTDSTVDTGLRRDEPDPARRA
ncbi:MAG: hypothetical protein KF901_32925 [Myxococcales bacterium]|nr:hypothetical protein [Myxococcales bacterium]